jgi:hypothetical protein
MSQKHEHRDFAVDLEKFAEEVGAFVYASGFPYDHAIAMVHAAELRRSNEIALAALDYLKLISAAVQERS